MINKKPIILFFLGLFLLNIIASSSYGEEIIRENYLFSRSQVERTITQGNLFEDVIAVTNLMDRKLSVTFTTSGDIGDIIEFTSSGIEIFPGNVTYISFYIKGTELGNYSGEIYVSGDITESIPVSILIVNSSSDPNFIIEVEPIKKYFRLNKEIAFKLNINKIKLGETQEINLTYSLNDTEGNYFLLNKESFNLTSSYHVVKTFQVPEEASKGDYILNVLAETNKEFINTGSQFVLKKPFLTIVLFGFLPIWVLLLFLLLIIGGSFIFILIKNHIKNSKKYKMELDVKKLPKFNKNSLKLGKIAEMNIGAYLEPERMKTHTIIAGATGGGKSISAQAIVEEVLLQNHSIPCYCFVYISIYNLSI